MVGFRENGSGLQIVAALLLARQCDENLSVIPEQE
jgi:hypothetical protein